MLDRLKRIILRLRGPSGGLPPFSPPADPDTGVRQPAWRRRPGGGGVVAVAEPDDEGPSVAAVAGAHRESDFS